MKKIYPSFVDLDKIDTMEYERSILDGKADGIYVLIAAYPFTANIKKDIYNKYLDFIISLSKKHNIEIIGCFDQTEIRSCRIQDAISEKKAFRKELEQYIQKGIKKFVRPSKWLSYDFEILHDGIEMYAPDEDDSRIIKRLFIHMYFESNMNYLNNGIKDCFSKIKIDKDVEYPKKISQGHPDNSIDGRWFAKAVSEASPRTLAEIDDIYFGALFTYDKDGIFVRYGNIMDVYACKEHIDYLFDMQSKLGISISLTMNSMEHPLEMINNRSVLLAFIDFIDSFYKRGLRVCTISNIHLISSGVLQNKFPEMKWKNTVNHKISNVQEILDYHALGYDYIQLDRSLSRNIKELERISLKAKEKGIKIYLLASEKCMPSCPFKVEHDNTNQKVTMAGEYFRTTSMLSCDKWRSSILRNMPRAGTNLFVLDKNSFDKYAHLVDVFKYSGRLSQEYLKSIKIAISAGVAEEGNFYETIEDALQDECYNLIALGHFAGREMYNGPNKMPKNVDSAKVHELGEVLQTCKNQCYKCHKCEEAYGIEKFDSLIEYTKKGNFICHN